MNAHIRLPWVSVGLAGLVLAAGCDQPASPRLQADLMGSSGTLAVAATTSGSDTDPDGYTARVDTASAQHVDPNGLVTYTGLATGTHRVDLYGVAGNCWAIGFDPRPVDVTAGLAGGTRFDVGCVAEGSAYVTDSTTGVDLDPDGYTVTVDGSTSNVFAANDTTWFNGLSSYGTHTIALSGLAPNCTLSGPNPQTFAVASGKITSIGFVERCAPPGSGSRTLTITTGTTGTNLDPDGYTVIVDGTTSRAIGTNGSASFTVAAGAHPVALSGIAPNCAVSGDNPRTVSVPAGGRGTTTFALTCGAQPPTEMRGVGQLKLGPTTNGQFVQSFAFDVRADGTGRFTFTDWSDIHPSGQAGTVVTDPAADPATSFTVRVGSTACADPSRGLEFDAVGREDEGNLRSYSVELCDNGPPGAGTDFLSIWVPDEGYGRSGILTSGDIARR